MGKDKSDRPLVILITNHDFKNSGLMYVEYIFCMYLRLVDNNLFLNEVFWSFVLRNSFSGCMLATLVSKPFWSCIWILSLKNAYSIHVQTIIFWLVFLSRNYWSLLDHDLMASIWEKNISIFVGNLNSGRSYLIAAVMKTKRINICNIIIWVC